MIAGRASGPVATQLDSAAVEVAGGGPRPLFVGGPAIDRALRPVALLGADQAVEVVHGAQGDESLVGPRVVLDGVPAPNVRGTSDPSDSA